MPSGLLFVLRKTELFMGFEEKNRAAKEIKKCYGILFV